MTSRIPKKNLNNLKKISQTWIVKKVFPISLTAGWICMVRNPSECIPWILDTTEDTVFKTTSDRQLIEDLGKESPLQKWFYSACLIVTPKDCLYQWVYEIDEDFLVAFISKSLLGEKRLRELNEVAFPSKDALLADRYLTFYFQNNENALSSDCLQELFSLATSFDLSRLCSSLYDCLDEFESVINTSQFLKWSVEALLGLILLLIPSGESVFFLRIRDDLIPPLSVCCKSFLSSARVWELAAKQFNWFHFRNFMKTLCASRISVLKLVQPPAVTDSWLFPEIKLPTFYGKSWYPSQLQDFLKSETATLVTFQFEKLYEYRTFAWSFLKAHPYYYSLKMTTNNECLKRKYGDETIYKVTVSKTRAYFQKQVQVYQETQESIVELGERIKFLESGFCFVLNSEGITTNSRHQFLQITESIL
jgi:hypothetical protein